MAEDFPTLNGNAVSWADITVSVAPYDGTELDNLDLVDISWGMTIERTNQLGRGGYVKNRSRGGRGYSASLTLYRSGLKSMVRQLKGVAKAKGYTRNGQILIGNVGFDILIQHTPLGTSEVEEVKIKGAMIDELSQSLAEGNDVDKVTVTLNTVQVVMIDEKEEVLL